MTVSWSLDKVGPMCRSVEDCALVLAAIQGPDNQDLSVQTVPFNWDATLDIRKLRVGYLKSAFANTKQTAQTDANDAKALDVLRNMGVSLIEVRLPEQPRVDPLTILYSEANAALKDPLRTRPADLVRQDRVAAQNALRLVPAADYLDANRARTLLMREMARIMSEVRAEYLGRRHGQKLQDGERGKRQRRVDGWAGSVVVAGTLFVNSGYGAWGGIPGNALLAFSVK